jgi:DNA-binding IclR family transcriptional regulator
VGEHRRERADVGSPRGRIVREPDEIALISDASDDADAADHAARGGIQALDAALLVLRAIAACSGPVTLTDLARSTGMSVSKAHRYLASFIHAGLVLQRERSGRYELGPFSAELGLAALSRNEFVNRTADGLEELSERTGLTALLSVWANQGATVVRWERAASPVLTSFGLGSTLPLLGSASGRIFLAYLPRRLTAPRLRFEIEDARKANLKWPDLDLTAKGVERLIASVRESGSAWVDGRFIPGLKAVSSPVTNWQGEAEVAVTLIGASDDILKPEGRARAQLREYTERMSVPRIQA